MGAIGVKGSSCNSLSSLLPYLHVDMNIKESIMMKAMNISIRSSYYVFCNRNKPWTNQELLTIYFAPFSLFVNSLYALYKQANFTLPCT